MNNDADNSTISADPVNKPTELIPVKELDESSDTSSYKSDSRREFLTKLGIVAAGAATVIGSQSVAVAAQSLTKRKIQYAMVIDTRRCTGCHACSVACKSENDVPIGNTRSWVEYIEKGEYPNVGRSFLPRLCNQCSEPSCVDVCPTGATYKREEDGIVVVDADKCIGCKYCIQACPYDARYLNPETGTVDKCDFCLHRVSKGLVPSCVNTCEGRARIFGDINDPESEVSKLLATNAYTVLHKGMGNEPNVFYLGADLTDPHSAIYKDSYVRIETHRKEQERR